jgi:hypothetical protein
MGEAHAATWIASDDRDRAFGRSLRRGNSTSMETHNSCRNDMPHNMAKREDILRRWDMLCAPRLGLTRP